MIKLIVGLILAAILVYSIFMARVIVAAIFKTIDEIKKRNKKLGTTEHSNNFWNMDEPVSIKANLQLKYEDSNGSKTKRIVSVSKMGPHGSGYMIAGYCSLRKKYRTFLTERIIECVDTETGEFIEDVVSYLKDKYKKTPISAINEVSAENYDFLRVLLYIGKADGRLTISEKTVICDCCKKLSNDENISVEAVSKLLSQYDVPAYSSFQNAVTRLKGESKDIKKLLYETCKEIINTQKTIHPKEKEALEYIEKFINI